MWKEWAVRKKMPGGNISKTLILGVGQLRWFDVGERLFGNRQRVHLKQHILRFGFLYIFFPFEKRNFS